MGDQPRQMYWKHLHYKDGRPKFSVVESDELGPSVILLKNGMDGTSARWRRIQKVKDDYMFEREPDGPG